MPDNVLYIIGNGFDLHHGIHSSYKYFSVWLKRHNHILYQTLLNVCCSNELWWNFEAALAYINRGYMLDAAELGLLGCWDEDKDPAAELFLAGDIARTIGADLWKDIVRSFRRWVSTIRWERNSDKRKLRIDTEARFLNFNYTTFLESRYGIDNSQILYVHGRQSSVTNPPIIGHGDVDTFDEWYQRADRDHKQYYHGRRSDLPEIDMMTSGVEEYFELSQKPVENIITKNKEFFDDLYDVEHVYVLGHSLNTVDIPYLQAVETANDAPVAIWWHVSYYSEEERTRLANRLHASLSSCRSQIDMFRLEEMMLDR